MRPPRSTLMGGGARLWKHRACFAWTAGRLLARRWQRQHAGGWPAALPKLEAGRRPTAYFFRAVTPISIDVGLLERSGAVAGGGRARFAWDDRRHLAGTRRRVRPEGPERGTCSSAPGMLQESHELHRLGRPRTYRALRRAGTSSSCTRTARILVMPTERAAAMKQLPRRPPARDPRHRRMTGLYLLEPRPPGRRRWGALRRACGPLAELRAGRLAAVRERWESGPAERRGPRPSLGAPRRTSSHEGPMSRRFRPVGPRGRGRPSWQPRGSRPPATGSRRSAAAGPGAPPHPPRRHGRLDRSAGASRWDAAARAGVRAESRWTASSCEGASTWSPRSSGSSAKNCADFRGGALHRRARGGASFLGDPSSVVVMGGRPSRPGVVFDVAARARWGAGGRGRRCVHGHAIRGTGLRGRQLQGARRAFIRAFTRSVPRCRCARRNRGEASSSATPNKSHDGFIGHSVGGPLGETSAHSPRPPKPQEYLRAGSALEVAGTRIEDRPPEPRHAVRRSRQDLDRHHARDRHRGWAAGANLFGPPTTAEVRCPRSAWGQRPATSGSPPTASCRIARSG